MTLADVFAITLGAGAGLIASYCIVMWLARRVIDGIGEITKFE